MIYKIRRRQKPLIITRHQRNGFSLVSTFNYGGYRTLIILTHMTLLLFKAFFQILSN